MTVALELELKPFVLLRLGEQRFAVAASQIAELVAPSRVFRFPHRTEKIEGVILRRGRMVPVCDVAVLLTGKRVADRRLYLIAQSPSGWPFPSQASANSSALNSCPLQHPTSPT